MCLSRESLCGFSFEQVLFYRDLLFGSLKNRESVKGKSLVEVRDEKKSMHPKGRSIEYSGMEDRAQRDSIERASDE